MTIDEAAAKGISRLRKDIWSSKVCYLKIDIIKGVSGPWFKLYDRITQKAIEVPTPQNWIDMPKDKSNDYFEYVGVLDKDE